MRRRTWIAAAAGAAALPWWAGCSVPPVADGAPLRADGSAIAEPPLGEAAVSPRLLRRISVGSCADESKPQPVWNAVLADRPDLHLFGGDNIYASEQPWRVDEMRRLYGVAEAIPGMAALRRSVPHLAIWDDHDYGLNDGGADWAFRQAAKDEFLRFWRIAEADERRARVGLYHARRFGPAGRTVQVILLDVRWFRSPWQPTDQRGAPGKERYVPSDDRGRTMLGDEQWQWLEDRLREPAELRLVVSGIQVIAEGHGFEHWGLFPHEQQRLLDAIARTRAQGVVLVSGDRHIGAVYRRRRGAAYPLTEITSSGLTHAWAQASEPGPNRLGELVRVNHYALIDIDWPARTLALVHRDERGQTVQQHTLSLDSLRPT